MLAEQKGPEAATQVVGLRVFVAYVVLRHDSVFWVAKVARPWGIVARFSLAHVLGERGYDPKTKS